jgi:uncharacterized protein YbjT (DUF2867 family)
VGVAGIAPGLARAHAGKAGHSVSKLSFHSLRHSFTSELARAGVAPEIRQRLTGHADLTSHKTYTHLELAGHRGAARLAAVIYGHIPPWMAAENPPFAATVAHRHRAPTMQQRRLSSPVSGSKTYELARDQSFWMAELASEVSRQIGRDPYRNLSGEDYAAILLGFGLPQMIVDVIIDADTKAIRGDWIARLAISAD